MPDLDRARRFYVWGDEEMRNGHPPVYVEWTCGAGQGPHKPERDTWAIRCMGRVLNRDNEWEWEPQPSSREDDFLAATRFDRDDALRRAEAAPAIYEQFARGRS